MAITPETNIKLIKCPLTLSNKNQLTFSNKTTQYNYFNSLPKLEIDECSYQRKDNILRYPAHIDTIIEYNYCMYQNDNYSDKWFYAFIENMEYDNDGLTNITLKTDVFQTWQFDIDFKDSFVEREHVNSDLIGEHLVEENLDVGTPVCVETVEDASLSTFNYVAIMSNYDPGKDKQFDGITIRNRTVFGNQIFLVNMNPINNLDNLLGFISKANETGHIEDIKDIFIIPASLVDPSQISQVKFKWGNDTIDASVYKYSGFSDEPDEFTTNIPFQNSFGEYIPKNNKCFIYPYNYLLVSNNSGNINTYRYEFFNNIGSTGNATFNTQLAIGVGVSGRLVPTNYKGMQSADDEAIPLAKYPTCGWSADSYTNWLTQNAINLPVQIVSSLVGTGQNFINSSIPQETPKTLLAQTQANMGTTANLVGQIGGIATNVAGTIGQFYSASLMPNIEGGNSNIGDVLFSAKRNCFTFRKMQCDTRFIKIIDNFFTMYGYKINLVKKPNLTGRSNWNYVKCIDSNILGNIPQMDLAEIKEMFDNGVTLWHTTSNFLDYSQNNSII